MSHFIVVIVFVVGRNCDIGVEYLNCGHLQIILLYQFDSVDIILSIVHDAWGSHDTINEWMRAYYVA